MVSYPIMVNDAVYVHNHFMYYVCAHFYCSICILYIFALIHVDFVFSYVATIMKNLLNFCILKNQCALIFGKYLFFLLYKIKNNSKR